MTPMLLLIAHLTGDYVLQSSWMATRKQQAWWPALAHGAAYTLPHLALTQSPAALAVIGITHILLDHYDVAPRVVWFRNHLGPRSTWRTWADCKDNQGSPPGTPPGLAVGIKIVVDNTIHLAINVAAVLWL